MTGLQIAKAAAKIFDDKLAVDVKVLKVKELTIIADYFVIVSGQSSTQVASLADEAEYQLELLGVPSARKEGSAAGGWIVLDYETVIMHIFHSDAREFYSLERLWADAKQIDIG